MRRRQSGGAIIVANSSQRKLCCAEEEEGHSRCRLPSTEGFACGGDFVECECRSEAGMKSCWSGAAVVEHNT